MTLDEQILREARDVRDRLLELRHEEERAQADLHHAIRRLHAAGGSLREIADELGVSHQRVHQIVGSAPEPLRGPRRRGFGRAFVRFTRAARRALETAEEAAAALGHGRIGTEHVLLGLARTDGGGAAQVLAQSGLDVDRLHAAVQEAGTGGSGPGRAPFTPRAKRALQAALEESERLGTGWVGTEHLLLALAGDRKSGARDLLARLGCDPEDVASRTLALLGDTR